MGLQRVGHTYGVNNNKYNKALQNLKKKEYSPIPAHIHPSLSFSTEQPREVNRSTD